jgi:phosphate acetyltransferase
VAGHADVLIAPSMESAIILQRTLTALTQGLAAGLVLGARVPIVLVSRSDTLEARTASCVLALLMHASAAARPAASPAPPSGNAPDDGAPGDGRAIAA